MTMSWFSPRPFIVGLLLSVAGSSFASESILLSTNKERFIFLNAARWKIGEVGGRESLILNQPGPQRPPVRRPGEFAVLKRECLFENYSFMIEACSLELASKKERDICLIFGYQDDTNFYYAHISSDSNGTYHPVIMKVRGDTRTKINREDFPEPRLPDGWRIIKLAHQKTGEITVWVDDLKTPILTAHDTTFPSGSIGFGSFDDRAAFWRLEVE